MAIFLVNNGPMQTTTAQAAVTTGTAIKTMLQLVPNATAPKIKIVEWGISFDGSAAATPIKVELIQTDVAATVTAFVAADITRLSDPDGEPSTIQLGTALSGYTASAEGTTTVSHDLDSAKFIAPTNQYEKQFPLGQEPTVQLGKFCRIRVTAGAAVNCYCYIKWSE